MAEKTHPTLTRPPESNAQVIANRLIYNFVDLDGSGVIQVLQLLQARAEQVRSLTLRLNELDQKVQRKEITHQEEYNAELLDGLYETTCLRWFLACTLKELARRLESEVYGAQIRLNPIRQITFTEDGQVESFLLDFPDVEPGGANI